MIIHIAGLVVTIEGRIIQRCAVCGEKLNDSKNCAMPVELDGSPPIFPVWQLGCYVEVDGNRSMMLPDSEFSWANSCIALVED